MYSTTFGVWDYLVFGSMLAVSICIGIYHAVRGKNQSTSEYLVAGHSMTFLPVTLSLIATYLSSIMMLGMPAESYAYGFSWILAEMGEEMGNILDIILMLAFIRRLDLSTPYEYFERRFQSRGLRLLTNVMTCLSYLIYMSTVMYGQAIALQTVTGFSMYGSIAVTATAAVVYTTIGGLKAVIWTDVLQFLIMFTGLLAVSIKGTLEGGGAGEIWTRARRSGRLDFSLDPDPTVRHTVWNLFFGRIITGFGFLIKPPTFQRISSTKSPADATKALLTTPLGIFLITGTALAEGIVAYGYYSYKGCDPLISKQIETPNKIVPFMIMDLFHNQPGMPGLFFAALSSASLSTISSCLSAISIITWYDLFKPQFPNMSEFKGLVIAKTTVVVSGCLGCVLAITVSLVSSHTLNQISHTLQAMTRNPVVGLFYLGALFPFVNAKGATTGFVTGIVVMGWLVIGSMFSTTGGHTPYLPLGPNDQCPALNLSTSLSNITTDSPTTPYAIMTTSGHNTTIGTRPVLELIYSLSYTLFSTMAILIVFLVGIITSLLTGGLKTRADPDMVIHLSDIQCWWRPRGYHADANSNERTDTTTRVEELLLTESHQHL